MPRIAVTTKVFPEAILEVHAVPKKGEAIKVTLGENQIVWKEASVVDPMIGNTVVITGLGPNIETSFEGETLPLCFLTSLQELEEREEQEAREEEELVTLSCSGLLTKIKQLVASRQKEMQIAYEDGPYWARQVKEGIINNLKDLLNKSTAFLECDCEDAHKLREVKGVVCGPDEETNQVKGGEIGRRMMVDHTYYVLEGLLGFTKGERPSMKIMGPDIGEKELHIEDVL